MECDVIGEQVGMRFETGGECGRGGIRWSEYDANRPAILKWNLMGLGVDGNRQVWVQNWRKGVHSCSQRESGGFLNVKSIAYIALELVDKVHRHAVGMGSYRVSEVGT